MAAAYEALMNDNKFISAEAEESLIAALVSGNKIGAKEAIVSQLSDSDFGVPECGAMFKAAQRIIARGTNADIITVDAELRQFVPEMADALNSKLIDIVTRRLATIYNADGHVEVIKTLSARRSSIKAAHDALKELENPTMDLDKVLDKLARATVTASLRKGHEWHDMTNVMLATFDNLERRLNGEIVPITTGVSCVDKMIGGFFGGELTIIAARPSVGKSAFGANIALEAAKDGYQVAVVSREMTDVQFGQRLLSRQSGINGMKIRSANVDEADLANIGNAMSELSVLPIRFMFTLSTIEDLRKECIALKQEKKLDILVVDYLQLMDTAVKTEEDRLRVGRISKGLKDIAVDLNIPVIALAQVLRSAEGQMPTLSMLKDSGSIEQDADGVIFLHRPLSVSDSSINPVDREYFESYKQHGLTYLSIGVAKQRQGAIGKANILFNADKMIYTEIDRGR